jgi:hypothetical protein
MEGSPWTGADGEVAASGRLGRRAQPHGGGGTPALHRPREGVEEALLDAWMLVAVSASPVDPPSRRIGGSQCRRRLATVVQGGDRCCSGGAGAVAQAGMRARARVARALAFIGADP